ncbi:zf-HC2 domain-containing protein [Candidatus Poribacteria bacterium]|nr:zf-HC2 domain-containing protein [Candidatus Poribacteria bacterium]
MGSKCEKIERLLSDYMDGTLSERQQSVVALHLRSCRSCKREVVDLKKTNHLLENFYVEPEASDAYYAGFTTRLQHRIEQSAPTALHQRLLAVATRLGWHLLTQFHRRIDHSRLGGFLSIRQHAFPYYIFGLTLTMLVVAPLLLNQVAPQEEGNHVLGRLYAAAKIRFFSADSPISVQPTAALAIKQDQAGAQPIDLRRSVEAGLPSPYKRTTDLPVIDSGSDVWLFTDEPMTEGYIFTALQENDSDTVPSVALDIDSELLAYAELPAHGAFWARLTGRDVLTESRYALLLLQGMDAGQHALQQYERKWSGFKGFSQKLLDVPLEILSIPEVYDSREL